MIFRTPTEDKQLSASQARSVDSSPSHMDCTLALGKLPCACPSVGLECHRLNIARLAKDTEPREFHAPPGKCFGSLLESYTSTMQISQPPQFPGIYPHQSWYGLAQLSLKTETHTHGRGTDEKKNVVHHAIEYDSAKTGKMEFIV